MRPTDHNADAEPSPGSDPPAEAELVAAARSGDRAAFQQLYRRYGRAVRCVVLARSGWQEAEDLMQDVFLRAWKRLDQLREVERFGPWLMQVARNRCADHVRQRRSFEQLPVQSIHMAPRLEAIEVLEAVQRLPEAYRETLLMRLVEGMSGPEIAAQTGLKPRSVRVNLHRGLARLRAELKEEEP